MRPRDRKAARRLDSRLRRFNNDGNRTPGLSKVAHRETFIEQILESARRASFPAAVAQRPISPLRRDPDSPMFDPIRAAILNMADGGIEEALWLIFLSVHFGRHARSGWQYARSVYGRLGVGGRWDWDTTSANPRAFRSWLRKHEDAIRATGGGFGNHRKYQGLSADTPVGTGAVVEAYIDWVKAAGSHVALLEAAKSASDGDPTRTFDALYRSMAAVAGFGRTARFDYLTMIGKLEVWDVEPGSAYLSGATGPLRGARLLFGDKYRAKELDRQLVDLDKYLSVGVLVLEDALCNWQKSPAKFIAFRG